MQRHEGQDIVAAGVDERAIVLFLDDGPRRAGEPFEVLGQLPMPQVRVGPAQRSDDVAHAVPVAEQERVIGGRLTNLPDGLEQAAERLSGARHVGFRVDAQLLQGLDHPAFVEHRAVDILGEVIGSRNDVEARDQIAINLFQHLPVFVPGALSMLGREARAKRSRRHVRGAEDPLRILAVILLVPVTEALQQAHPAESLGPMHAKGAAEALRVGRGLGHGVARVGIERLIEHGFALPIEARLGHPLLGPGGLAPGAGVLHGPEQPLGLIQSGPVAPIALRRGGPEELDQVIDLGLCFALMEEVFTSLLVLAAPDAGKGPVPDLAQPASHGGAGVVGDDARFRRDPGDDLVRDRSFRVVGPSPGEDKHLRLGPGLGRDHASRHCPGQLADEPGAEPEVTTLPGALDEVLNGTDVDDHHVHGRPGAGG